MEHLSPSSCLEKRVLSDSEDVVRFAFGKNVVLNVTHNKSNICQRDSSRANSQILTDYKWENKANYAGRILAVREKLVAYRLFNENTGEAVRVLERVTRARHLIKDFRYPIVDLQWAVHALFLAVLDTNSNVYVYHVDEKCNTLSKYLNIIRDDSPQTVLPKLSWCPYIPDSESDRNKDLHLLAVTRGNCIDIFSLHTIKSSLNKAEVCYEQLFLVPGGLLTLDLTLESNITSIKLSPDATAMAIATLDGNISFYVIDNDKTRFANRVRPLPNSFVEDILFLDNLSIQNQEQFWKYVAVLSDSGRRLAIFECDHWNCLAKLRFESPNQINRFEFSIDQTARFIFMADYDSSSLYCLELDYVSSQPCFTACTQIRFFNSLVYIVPCNVAENIDCDLSLEDLHDLTSSNSICATFVAITNRSLIETCIDLEHYQLDPNALIFGSGNQSLPMSISTAADCSNNDDQISTSAASGGSTLATAIVAKDLANLLNIQKPSLNSKNNFAAKRPLSSNSNSKAMSEFSVQFQDSTNEKLTFICEKVEELQGEVEKLHQANRNFHDTTEILSKTIEKISTEIKLQHTRIETILSESSTVSREQIVLAVESALSAGNLSFQSILELSQEANLETIRSLIGQLLMPAIEGVCSHLFKQLNESFRDGLQEFMDQINTIQKQSADSSTPLLGENASLAQLLETGQIPLAFEKAVLQRDLTSLMFVCNKIDPDLFFSNSSPQLSSSILLSILHQLVQTLEVDTDLKLRYVENILMCLNDSNIQKSDCFRPTLELLLQASLVFMKTDTSATYKRQTRIITQLIGNLLRDC